MSEAVRADCRRILGVGIATLDIIYEVAAFPNEDEEVRALSMARRRGGNVTNTLVVLSQLGRQCTWIGTLGDDANSSELVADLDRYRVDSSRCVRVRGGVTPTSCVVLSRANGTRTIVHYRDLPELTAGDFARIDFGRHDWVHFEGREPAETAAMLRDLLDRHPDCPVSLEVEKSRPGVEDLLMGPQVIFFSRAYALSVGHTDPDRFLAAQWAHTTAGLIVLPWGERGAYAQARGDSVHFAPPYPPPKVRDTLGAGDVFNAAVIDGLLAGLAPPDVLARANLLAGHKCGRDGLAGLGESARSEGLFRALSVR
ncbi:MAG: PfkB family carbohydrate kinase [Chromatiaceae bacterium]